MLISKTFLRELTNFSPSLKKKKSAKKNTKELRRKFGTERTQCEVRDKIKDSTSEIICELKEAKLTDKPKKLNDEFILDDKTGTDIEEFIVE